MWHELFANQNRQSAFAISEMRQGQERRHRKSARECGWVVLQEQSKQSSVRSFPSRA